MNLFNHNLRKTGLASVANARIRGKIRHEEWPNIVARYKAGETLTEIARSYHCTAPAIRYIVNRSSVRAAKSGIIGRHPANSVAVLSNRVSLPLPRGQARAAGALQQTQLWSRMNREIATYLAEMDLLAAHDSDGNYETLLVATDRLLRATARARLELEGLLAVRRKSGQARRTTA